MFSIFIIIHYLYWRGTQKLQLWARSLSTVQKKNKSYFYSEEIPGWDGKYCKSLCQPFVKMYQGWANWCRLSDLEIRRGLPGKGGEKENCDSWNLMYLFQVPFCFAHYFEISGGIEKMNQAGIEGNQRGGNTVQLYETELCVPFWSFCKWSILKGVVFLLFMLKANDLVWYLQELFLSGNWICTRGTKYLNEA